MTIETVQLTAVVTGGVPPYSYAWNFGDGTTGSGNPVVHSYSQYGTFPVTVTVKDSLGVSLSGSASLVVSAPSPNGPRVGQWTTIGVNGGSLTTYMGVSVITGAFGGNPGPLVLSNGETVGFGAGIPTITGLPLINTTWLAPGYTWQLAGYPQGSVPPLDSNPPLDLTDMGYMDAGEFGLEVWGSPSTDDLYVQTGIIGWNPDGSEIVGWFNIGNAPKALAPDSGTSIGYVIIGGKQYDAYSALKADISSGVVAANIAATSGPISKYNRLSS